LHANCMSIIETIFFLSFSFVLSTQ
jgi:hypothetical protein